jgi:hypothetical protein
MNQFAKGLWATLRSPQQNVPPRTGPIDGNDNGAS